MQNIAPEFWKFVKETDNKKVFNWLNRDNLEAIILNDNNVFWIEKTNTTSPLPDYIYNLIIKWGKSKGFTPLYD